MRVRVSEGVCARGGGRGCGAALRGGPLTSKKLASPSLQTTPPHECGVTPAHTGAQHTPAQAHLLAAMLWSHPEAGRRRVAGLTLAPAPLASAPLASTPPALGLHPGHGSGLTEEDRLLAYAWSRSREGWQGPGQTTCTQRTAAVEMMSRVINFQGR